MISGTISLPGDKSISHRAALFSALFNGESHFTNFNSNEDCTATLNCLAQLGIKYTLNGKELTVWGKALKNWQEPKETLYAANSGTTARLLSGLLSSLKFNTTLSGDASLSKRPMQRILTPLSEMGAHIESNAGYLPLTFSGGAKLKGIKYTLPVASAQVKSAILLAGLSTSSPTSVIESKISRDHTERMLGLEIVNEKGLKTISSSINNAIPNLSMKIPGDFSSAAFYITAALCLPGSKLILKDVSLNPTRTGFLSVIKQMGAQFKTDMTQKSPEPMGNIHIQFSTLKNITIPKEIVPNIIDEIPILAILATQSEGRLIIRNAKELRFKESDRIETITSNLENLGVKTEIFEDGFALEGKQDFNSGTVKSKGDHRIAMAFSIANLFTKSEIKIDNPDCASVSFPDFYTILESIVK